MSEPRRNSEDFVEGFDVSTFTANQSYNTNTPISETVSSYKYDTNQYLLNEKRSLKDYIQKQDLINIAGLLAVFAVIFFVVLKLIKK